MSNFHYNDQGTCKDCSTKASYTDLGDTTNYNCDLPCLCRYTSERSDKDKMYYDYFVLGQPMNLAPMKQNGGGMMNPAPAEQYRGNKGCCGGK